MINERFAAWLKADSSPGVLLLLAAVLAMLAANGPAAPLYDELLGVPVAVQVGAFVIHKPLLLWINDGLMAVFFLFVGLELKHELLHGELSTWQRAALPVAGAVGGIVVPASIYAFLNYGDAQAMQGWAIPTATDIAFAVGIMALLGSRVPGSLKLFLLALAIIDDLGAVIIIALFYTDNISMTSLVVAGAACAALLALNRNAVLAPTPYVLLGLVLWVSVLKSGVHATLAGVVMAAFVPGQTAERMLEGMKSWVSMGIIPVFAFANAGVGILDLSWSDLTHPVPLGIALGLFVGKQVGVFGVCWLAIRFGIARKLADVNWMQFYGASVLCGIGFTMSLFIGSLAFEQGATDYVVGDRLGILLGSLLSGMLGAVLLFWGGKKRVGA